MRVLMIGNSLTYTNDLPGLLQQLSAGEYKPIVIDSVTSPMVSLRFHWNFTRARRTIANGHWDYVILQDFSRLPATNPERSIKYFSLFDEEIRRSGAKTILFENWTRKAYQDDYAPLLATYGKIREQTGAKIAPIGEVWHKFRAEHPEIALLKDDRHPTAAGTYLAACVLYDVLYLKPSSALPLTLGGPDLPAGEIQMLRAAADKMVIHE